MSKSLMARLIAIIVAVALLYVALRSISPNMISSRSLVAIALAQPFALAAVIFSSLRLKLLAGWPATNGAAFRATCISVALFIVLPGRLSEGVKPLVLSLSSNLPLMRGLATVTIERFLDATCVAAILVLLTGFAASTPEIPTSATVGLVVAVAAGIAVLGIVALAGEQIKELLDRIPSRSVRSGLLEAYQMMKKFAATRQSFLPAFYSALTWLASYCTFAAVILCIAGEPITYPEIAYVFVFATFGNIVAVAPGGIGTFEAAIAFALKTLGYSLADGLAVAVVLRVASLLPAVVATSWIVWNEKLSLSMLADQIRRIRKDRSEKIN